jgi:isoquinoline 1-oxidoreductase beta subunit
MTDVRERDLTVANVSRRAFLGGVAAGSLVLAIGLPPLAEAQEKKFGGDGMPQGLRDDPRLFVSIAPDGIITVTCHRQEMGQGVRTSIAMVIADELEADWAKVRVVQAPGDEARYGNQDTDGSRTLRHHFMPLRRVGAAARGMLEQAAALQWGVPVQEVHGREHAVLHEKTGRRLDYGALASAAAAQQVPARAMLKLKEPSAISARTRSAWSTIRTSRPARLSTASTPASRECSMPSLRDRRSSAAGSKASTMPRR